ncbi:MAG: phage antirepressor [bacterium]|nr:phage antirepressor [bacterium]
MDNKLQIFTNEEFGSVRTVTIDGEPWFVGKDVATALGYERADNAIRKHVEAEDKLMHQIGASGQNRQMYIISESGLYSLILSSKLPTAKKFKHWITSEVIPSIRKHGVYMTNNLLDAVTDNPDLMCDVVERLKAGKRKTAELEKQLKMALPKAVYFDMFVDPGYATNFRDTAKEFQIPQKCFINLLLKHKFIYRKPNGELRPHGKALEKGLFILRDYTNPQNRHQGTYTLITTAGKKYIYEYFKKKEII